MIEDKEPWHWTSMNLPTIPRYFQATCDKFPDRTAQVFNPDLYHGDHGGRLSWRKLQARVEAIAGGIMELGIQSQDPVALMAPSGPHWTQVDLALACSGAVSVAVYPTLSGEEVVYIVNDSRCRMLFVGNPAILERLRPHLADMPSLAAVVVMDLRYRTGGSRELGLGELIARGEAWQANHGARYQARRDGVRLEDLCTVLYTSGTSGRGKGVRLTHWCIASRLEGVNEFFGRHGMRLTEADRTLCFLPLAHIFERGSCQMLAMIKGAAIAYADLPGTLLADLQKYQPTWINCVPRLYEKIYITLQQKMAENPVSRKLFDWALAVGTAAVQYRRDSQGRYDMTPGLDLAPRLPLGLRLRYRLADRLLGRVRGLFGAHFRFAFSASASIAPELLEFYYIIGLAVVEGYGSTESCNACLLNPLGACKPGYMGVNANGGWSRVAPDGELEISGAGIFKGYLNRPEEDAAAFTADGWFRTGDLVEVSGDGYFRLVDRKKAIICTSAGKNVAPAKVEGLFATSRVIEQVFVVGDDRACVTALIVPNFGHFAERFEREKIPYETAHLAWSDATGVRICTRVGEDFINQPRLRELVAGEVAAANTRLEHFEAIRNYTILPERFTEENGRLTPTQKAKKRIILQDYAAAIERMYRQ